MSRSRAETVATTYVAPVLRPILTALARAQVAFYDALEAFSGYEDIAAVADELAPQGLGSAPISAA